MRGTNGPMDVITRAEFEHSMRDYLTKDDLRQGLAETKAELVSTIKEKLEDLKIDLFAQVEEKVTRSHNLLQLGVVKASDLKDAKNEILATTRRNISEAISHAVAPLATKAELEQLATKADLEGFAKKADLEGFATKADLEGFAKTADLKGFATKADMEEGFLKNAARLDAMEHKINTIVMDGFSSLRETITSFTGEMREVVKKHERMLDRHDADLYKLRQSGVLQ